MLSGEAYRYRSGVLITQKLPGMANERTCVSAADFLQTRKKSLLC